MKSGHFLLKKDTFLHPANRLLAWCALTVYLSSVSFTLLIVTTATLASMAIALVPQAFKCSIRRMRWLLLALTVIFAWNVPGVYVTSNWYAPSIEGLYFGIQQSLYLISVSASLQIALKGMNQALLLSACYQLTRPFAWIGIDNTRFAVRLGLTLQYAEQWLTVPYKITWQTLGSLFDVIAHEQRVGDMTIDILPFSSFDSWMSVGILSLIGLLLMCGLWI